MKVRRLNFLVISILLLSSCSQKIDDNSNSEAVTLKLIPIVFGGNRYIVEADLGLEKSVPLMVHGNANLYLMITHEVAEKLNHDTPIQKLRDYGYSEKGMGKLNVAAFKLGGRTFSKDSALVFDWPKETGKAAQGMLGVHFLEKEKVSIDFVREEMQIGVPLSEGPDKALIEQGYSYTEFFIENGEGYMQVYFEALQKEIPITVGTVSDDFSFDAVTFQGSIAIEKTGEKANSPSHTSPELYVNSTPIKYSIANQAFEIPAKAASLHSFAEYQNVTQAELFPFGIFGRDWMKENKVILDYANRTLYFKVD